MLGLLLQATCCKSTTGRMTFPSSWLTLAVSGRLSRLGRSPCGGGVARADFDMTPEVGWGDAGQHLIGRGAFWAECGRWAGCPVK
jgi:hypothetical protein